MRGRQVERAPDPDDPVLELAQVGRAQARRQSAPRQRLELGEQAVAVADEAHVGSAEARRAGDADRARGNQDPESSNRLQDSAYLQVLKAVVTRWGHHLIASDRYSETELERSCLQVVAGP